MIFQESHDPEHLPGITAHEIGYPLISRSYRITNGFDLRGEGDMLLVLVRICREKVLIFDL